MNSEDKPAQLKPNRAMPKRKDPSPWWRKLFSSNWWWYGEVNPDPATLPPVEERPKFWRLDTSAMIVGLLSLMLLDELSTLLNSRSWTFNQTETTVGTLVGVKYSHPQLQIETSPTVVTAVAFPTPSITGSPGRGGALQGWLEIVDEVARRQVECPDLRLELDTQLWRMSLNPSETVWEVRCTSGPVLIPRQRIEQVFAANQFKARLLSYSFIFFVVLLFSVLIIRRERKRYV